VYPFGFFLFVPLIKNIMKPINTLFYSLFLAVTFVFFIQCCAQKSEKIAKTIVLQKNKTPKVYYQHWTAGVRGGGGGINLVISKSALPNITPIKAFFKNQEANIEHKKYDFVARFKTTYNQTKDDNLQKEHLAKNNISKKHSKPFPFQLNDNEAVLSYLEKGNIKYLKLMHIPEKEMLAYPSAPPNR